MKRLTSSAIPAQSILGMTSQKKNVYFQALPKLALPPPHPNSGNLVLFFPDVKNNVLRIWQKKVQMMMMMVEMIIIMAMDNNIDEIDDKNDQKHTNIITFE